MYDYDDYDSNYDSPAYPTGDPLLDREFERRGSMKSDGYTDIPEPVSAFLRRFRDLIADNNPYEISKMYEFSYPKLTEEFYQKTPWPRAEELTTILGITSDDIFFILYKELYFRHIYAVVSSGPTQDQRYESYCNYCKLFNYFLSSNTPVKMKLPNQWLWEIVDEFIYQFQCYQQFRAKAKEEFEVDNHVWEVLQVLNVLHSMVEKSCINKQLEVFSSGGDPDLAAGEFGRVSLYKNMGYFALVGLLRLHSLLGDFYQAIKVLENIDLNQSNLYSRVPGCQITTFYYVGFAYMMMRRYADAIRTFTSILTYINRTKNLFQAKNYQNDQINKQTEKMYTLLSMCLVLHPQRIDVSLNAVIKERYGESMSKMQCGDLSEFESKFAFASPKFLSPLPPSYDKESNEGHDHMESLKLQSKVFMDEVSQQSMLQTVRSFLQLYTSMPLEKLAEFMNTTVDDLEQKLLCFKHKMMNVVCKKGNSGLEGEFQSESEVDFFIDLNMIHIADTKVDARYGEYFINQIHKFNEMHRNIKSINI
ncbi:eukaryotic translation initiation factor 3 subunit L [Lepeophtheirus salmonis]|uniref:Eukaryotic translation initiation factor 3 subunit L n=1 Tax=Lepeophtheirus salmonis TaxID=72036 RepID=A0A0K2T0N6_LEPSM|nr:eukaryotic translation initiation factor 3 subunit L-like [Lepeophtheirus salmonis]